MNNLVLFSSFFQNNYTLRIFIIFLYNLLTMWFLIFLKKYCLWKMIKKMIVMPQKQQIGNLSGDRFVIMNKSQFSTTSRNDNSFHLTLQLNSSSLITNCLIHHLPCKMFYLIGTGWGRGVALFIVYIIMFIY